MSEGGPHHRINEKVPQAIISHAIDMGAEDTSKTWISSFDFLYMDDAVLFKESVYSVYGETYNLTLIWKNGIQRARAYRLL